MNNGALMTFQDILIKLMAAWLLLLGAAYVAQRQSLGISRNMLIASVRGLLQLCLLAWVLHTVLNIQSLIFQCAIVIGFCLLAAHTSASHYPQARLAWSAASIGLLAASAMTLPWLIWTGAIDNHTHTLIPLAGMLAANGMNALSMMFERIQQGDTAGKSIRLALSPSMDMLQTAGFVHMPGIFVGMLLAGSPPIQAASAQLTVFYMIITSSLASCIISFLCLNHWHKRDS